MFVRQISAEDGYIGKPVSLEHEYMFKTDILIHNIKDELRRALETKDYMKIS